MFAPGSEVSKHGIEGGELLTIVDEEQTIPVRGGHPVNFPMFEENAEPFPVCAGGGHPRGGHLVRDPLPDGGGGGLVPFDIHPHPDHAWMMPVPVQHRVDERNHVRVARFDLKPDLPPHFVETGEDFFVEVYVGKANIFNFLIQREVEVGAVAVNDADDPDGGGDGVREFGGHLLAGGCPIVRARVVGGAVGGVAEACAEGHWGGGEEGKRRRGDKEKRRGGRRLAGGEDDYEKDGW